MAWEIMASYNRTIQATPGQYLSGRDVISNLTSVLHWQVITAGKQQQVDIDNVQENARRVMHGYTIVNIVYVEMTGIYRKLYYNK